MKPKTQNTMNKLKTKKKLPENFYDKVYAVARMIPRGRVSSYGAIARYLSAGSAARMVGYALTCCHGATPFVPAHRVVNRIGLLTGKIHFGTPTLMQQLLENEGVSVENDQVQNFAQLYWDPVLELPLD